MSDLEANRAAQRAQILAGQREIRDAWAGAVCAECAGPIIRAASTPNAWLHVFQSDWVDNVHPATPSVTPPATPPVRAEHETALPPKDLDPDDRWHALHDGWVGDH